MMMGLGFWLMLLVISVPVLLLVSLVLLVVRPFISKMGVATAAGSIPTPWATRHSLCLQCGTRLQPEWVHCPECGAPTAGESRGLR